MWNVDYLADAARNQRIMGMHTGLAPQHADVQHAAAQHAGAAGAAGARPSCASRTFALYARRPTSHRFPVARSRRRTSARRRRSGIASSARFNRLRDSFFHRSARVFLARDKEGHMPCITRDKNGAFHAPRGALVRDAATLARLRKYAMPVAYTDACYAPSPTATIQATGRDAGGRLQYRYHASHAQKQSRGKFARLLKFAKLLPPLRKSIRAQLRQGRSDDKAHVAHQALHLLDQCRFRVGNPMYLERNQSHGLSNLETQHVKLGKRAATIEFRGKAGQLNTCTVHDPDTLRYLGQRLQGGGTTGKKQKPQKKLLFEYTGARGGAHQILPSDVNRILRQHGDITAKDFRTWQANLFYMQAVLEGRTPAQALEFAATKLYHTTAVCKSNYLHPDLIALDVGTLRQKAGQRGKGTEALERCLYRLLQYLQRGSAASDN